MAWVAVDKDNTEVVFAHYPKRANKSGYAFGKEEEKVMWLDGGDFVILPHGSIKKLIDRELKWNNEPVELT
jgi:hypothetical protein